MKKLLCILMAAASLLGLCACGAAPAAETTAAPTTKSAPTVAVIEGEPVEQLDDVSVYIPVTGEAKELEGLPVYTFPEGSSVKYREKAGRYDQVSHVFQRTDAASFITGQVIGVDGGLAV